MLLIVIRKTYSDINAVIKLIILYCLYILFIKTNNLKLNKYTKQYIFNTLNNLYKLKQFNN